MAKFIALLRGINVSGQKQIKMSALKILFEDLNFTNVQTYIQSGNVMFDSKLTNLKRLKIKIENRIKETFGFDVEVIVKTPDELRDALENNLFLKSKKNDVDGIYFTFLSGKPSIDNIKKLTEVDYTPEEYAIKEDVIYLYFPNGYGKSKMNNNFLEKKLRVNATTRNYKTVKALLEMAKTN
jgi:uncharacterized protein (DUF1697 family)